MLLQGKRRLQWPACTIRGTCCLPAAPSAQLLATLGWGWLCFGISSAALHMANHLWEEQPYQVVRTAATLPAGHLPCRKWLHIRNKGCQGGAGA